MNYMMMSRVRNSNWEDDEELKEDLERYVKQNLKREEILDFVLKKYPMYAWSLRTLKESLSSLESFQHQVYKLSNRSTRFTVRCAE